MGGEEHFCSMAASRSLIKTLGENRRCTEQRGSSNVTDWVLMTSHMHEQMVQAAVQTVSYHATQRQPCGFLQTRGRQKKSKVCVDPVSVGAVHPSRPPQIAGESRADRGRFCVVCEFHNRHIPSACILLHLSVPAASRFLSALRRTVRYGRLSARQERSPPEIWQRPWAWASDSPVLCWAGCWATVSLLALCPMLWFLSPLACRALPLQRPAAGRESPKPRRVSFF